MWQARELSARLAPVANLSEAEVLRLLDVFQSCSLVVRDAQEGAHFRLSPSHDSHLETLARVYVERPVTLFRVIYGLRDMKINTFADAFKLWR